MKSTEKTTSPRHHHTLAVGTLLYLGISTCVSLQAKDVEDELKEVVVQSGRLEQKQFDAPASVYTVDADTLRNSGPQVNISDVLNRVPGVVALNRNNYAQDVQISIRGFGARAAFGVRGIRLITDDIPASMPDGQGQASTIALPSVGRIEVLTGPLAQLYGNASGGVIQTFTREPGNKPEALVNLYSGSFGLRRTDSQVSERSGKIGFVADLSTFSISGYRAHSRTERTQLNSVMTVDATPDTRLKLVVNAFNMPLAEDPLGITQTQLDADPSQAGTNAIERNTRKVVNQKQVGLVVEHHFNSYLKLQTRAYTGTRDNLQYQTGAPTATGAWTGLDRQFEGVGLQAIGKFPLFDQKANWVLGVDYDHAQEQRQAGVAAAGNKSGSPTRNELNGATNQDYFAQVNWPVLELFTLTTGIRESNVTLKSRDDYVTATDPDSSGSVTYKATNPALGLTWHVQDKLNVYLNQGKGFETPTMVEAAYSRDNDNKLVEKFNPNLKASRSTHLELGTKWLPMAGTRLDAAWFKIDTDNEIVAAVTSGGKTAYDNAAQTKREGFQCAFQYQPSSNWRIQASATYMNATYQAGSASYSPPNGNDLPAIPKYQAFASLQWAEQGFRENSLGIEAGLDVIHRSSMWADDKNTASAPGFTLLNARVRQRYQLGPLRVEAYVGVDNLTDRNTVNSVIINQAAQRYFEPGLPRSWVVGVKAHIPLFKSI